MSRQYEKVIDGEYTVVIDDMNECKHMYDGVCCNDQSPLRGDYAYHEENCKHCELFEKEDGVTEW